MRRSNARIATKRIEDALHERLGPVVAGVCNHLVRGVLPAVDRSGRGSRRSISRAIAPKAASPFGVTAIVSRSSGPWRTSAGSSSWTWRGAAA